MEIFDPYELAPHIPNYFSYSGLDRDFLLREDDFCLDSVLEESETLIVPIWKSLNLFSKNIKKKCKPIPIFLKKEEAKDLIEIAKVKVYLGKQKIKNHYVSYLALDISSLQNDEVKNIFSPGCEFSDLREIGSLIDGIEGSILAYAKGIIFWHSQNKYCGLCGNITIPTKGGHQRICSRNECNTFHFPRIDPTVIMLIKNKERILLGRQKIWPAGLYSTLAGYVETGETIEHAVAREVYEEAGIVVKNIIYQHSQPWPFPTSLMLGFTAEACTDRINLNETELEDAQWFTRDEMLNFEKKGKLLPREVSISRRLIDDWLY